jgi:hypothetical protein
VGDDIVARLRVNAEGAPNKNGGHIWLALSPRTSAEAADLIEAQQDEIERLRGALALAVGELSTHAQYAVYSPDQLLEQFMQETRRGAD